jgi:hypothetical protein
MVGNSAIDSSVGALQILQLHSCILKCFIRNFKQDSLLGVNCFGLDIADSKKCIVKKARILFEKMKSTGIELNRTFRLANQLLTLFRTDDRLNQNSIFKVL